MARKFIITQTGSTIRRDKKQLRTLQCLGLGRIGKRVEQPATPDIIGMLKAVAHLVAVQEVKS